jgi:Putative Flp pilus-assembly TadE/G-like
MRAQPVLAALAAPFAALRARAHRPRGERGSFTFAVIFWTLMAMMLASLVVDGGLAITERQNAGDIAEQAARAGANDLDQNQLRAGTYQLLWPDACDKAQAVAVASGLDAAALTCDPPGTMKLVTGQTVPTMTVHVQIVYQPILIGLLYSGSFNANAAATAHPQPGT